MGEVKCYVLTIPDAEMFAYWMPKGRKLLDVLKGYNLLGVNTNSPEFSFASVFLFKTPLDRNNAYKAIHNVYPDTLCAINVQTALIDEKYLR